MCTVQATKLRSSNHEFGHMSMAIRWAPSSPNLCFENFDETRKRLKWTRLCARTQVPLAVKKKNKTSEMDCFHPWVHSWKDDRKIQFCVHRKVGLSTFCNSVLSLFLAKNNAILAMAETIHSTSTAFFSMGFSFVQQCIFLRLVRTCSHVRPSTAITWV